VSHIQGAADILVCENKADRNVCPTFIEAALAFESLSAYTTGLLSSEENNP
jgi:hypothetical protein